MSDRKPELYVWDDDGLDYYDNYVKASPADLVAAVRVGVESGTIEGAFVGRVGVDDNEGMDGIMLPYNYEHTGEWLCIPVDGDEG